MSDPLIAQASLATVDLNTFFDFTEDAWATCSFCLQDVCVCAPIDYGILTTSVGEPCDNVTRHLSAEPVVQPNHLSMDRFSGLQEASISPPTANERFLVRRARKAKRYPRRTRIDPFMKEILNDHFAKDTYPDEKTVYELHQKTGLPTRTVKTWFANSRSRKQTAQSVQSVYRLSLKQQR
jgi:hypothetical protein